MVDEREAALEDIRHEFVPSFYARQAPLVELRMTHFVREVILTEPERREFKDEDAVLCFSSVHKSQLDYVILGYQLYQHGYPAPRYIAGKNLFIPAISRDYLRKCGAICLDRERILRRDRVYIRAFSDYIREQVLGGGEHLLFFPEGGRSYDGRVGSPATGIYDSILHAQRTSGRSMLVVPLALTYDGVVEAASFPLLTRTRSMRSHLLRKLVYYVVDVGQILFHYFARTRFCGDVYIDVRPPFRVNEYASDRRAKITLARDVRAVQRAAVRVTSRALLATALPDDEGGRREEVEARLADLTAEARERGLPVTRTVAPMLAPGTDPARVLRAVVRASGGNVLLDDGRVNVKRPTIARYYRNTVAHHFEPATSR